MRKIVVKPIGDGWAVDTDGLESDMVFRSGRHAERAARNLSARLAASGETIEMAIHVRDGSVAARFVIPSNENDGGL